MIDKYSGRGTDFSVFALLDRESSGFLRSISVRDRRGRAYRGMHDALAAYHVLSVHGVPFEPVSHLILFVTFVVFW